MDKCTCGHPEHEGRCKCGVRPGGESMEEGRLYTLIQCPCPHYQPASVPACANCGKPKDQHYSATGFYCKPAADDPSPDAPSFQPSQPPVECAHVWAGSGFATQIVCVRCWVRGVVLSADVVAAWLRARQQDEPGSAEEYVAADRLESALLALLPKEATDG